MTTLVLQNKRSDYLFVDETPEGVHFTLTDKHGQIVRSAELPVNINAFLRSTRKSGFKDVSF